MYISHLMKVVPGFTLTGKRGESIPLHRHGALYWSDAVCVKSIVPHVTRRRESSESGEYPSSRESREFHKSPESLSPFKILWRLTRVPRFAWVLGFPWLWRGPWVSGMLALEARYQASRSKSWFVCSWCYRPRRLHMSFCAHLNRRHFLPAT